MLTVYDPTNWLATFNLSVHGQVYSNQYDALKSAGPRIAINDFINPESYDIDSYDLIFWTALENVNYFQKNITPSNKNRYISPTVFENGLCHTSLCYSLANKCYHDYIKPNLQAEYIADLFVGRSIRDIHYNRAWALHDVLRRGIQNRIIITAREIDINKSAPNLVDSPHWQTPLPDYNHLESLEFCQNFKGSLKDTFGDVLSKSNSLIMPWNIYQHSLYSVIVQDTDGIYMDEKIARPMLATRPFIIIGPQYYLRELKKLGFETFDPIIDESYDLEPNNELRWSKAMDALHHLSNQNPQSVYNRLKKRLQHNRKLVYNSEYWITRLKTWINSEIQKHTGIKCAIY